MNESNHVTDIVVSGRAFLTDLLDLYSRIRLSLSSICKLRYCLILVDDVVQETVRNVTDDPTK